MGHRLAAARRQEGGRFHRRESYAKGGRESIEAWQPGARAARLAVVRSVRCPTCRRETPWEGNPHRPFCSGRCRVLDLAAWADERYRIPGEPVPAEPDTPDAPGGPPPGRGR